MTQLPASLMAEMARIRPRVEKVATLLRSRLIADLSDLDLVSVTSRVKEDESVFQKLQTGRYSGMSEVKDLAALTVVLLTRRQIPIAIGAVKASDLGHLEEPAIPTPATDFSYREPKLYVVPPADYLERNPDLKGIVAEVQFTSTIQHALDMTTHDFDYKGRNYSWKNFRLVAQLRGMLELVDSMIDNIQTVSVPAADLWTPPSDVTYAAEILRVIVEHFAEDHLPSDRRRLAETVSAWTRALRLAPDDLAGILAQNNDLTAAKSVDPTSAILGCLLRHDSEALLKSCDRRFLVTQELESLCEEGGSVPEVRRVQLP